MNAQRAEEQGQKLQQTTVELELRISEKKTTVERCVLLQAALNAAEERGAKGCRP